MKRMSLHAALLAALAAAPAAAADPATLDWGAIPAKSVVLFYPGQSSYEWLRNDHAGGKGAAAARRGESCVKCHEGDERKMGEAIVKGGKLEPTPVKGKNGAIDLKVQAAYDAKNLYVRAQWKTLNPYPGDEYQYYRFDGREWKVHGHPKLDKVVQEGKSPAVYEDRFSILLDDGKVAGFAKQGCWLTCHDGSRDMAGQAGREAVTANPLYAAIKKDDVRKFLPETRTDPSDWKAGKPMADIDRLKSEGRFLELIQWRAHRSNPVGMADDGYVLEYRNFDDGKVMFSANLDAKTKQPRLMWNAGKTGYRAITEGDLRKARHYLLADDNAVPFDPDAGWKAGDMLPRYVLGRKLASGSAADNDAAGEWKDGTWTVVLVRPLGLANPDDKALKEGQVYHVGFAIHDDNITTRGHHVSFPFTLGIGTDADIRAVKVR